MSAQKDTVYIDVDDEITAIIEKLKASSSKIVALVLPKRAVALQSIVNMKLLKRAADDVGKRAVLITSEAGLLPLAGAVGVYIAKNLQSKPEIPNAPEIPLADEELLEAEAEPLEGDPEIDRSKSIDELVDDDVFEGAASATAASRPAGTIPKRVKTPSKKSTIKSSKSKRLPNFEKFRLKVFLGLGVLVLLAAAWWYGFIIAPKARLVITTETSSVNSSINFTASTTATEVDMAKKVIPAKEVEVQKTDSQKVPATGQKDLGTKASGSVTLSIPCSAIGGSPPQVPVGTGVSANGLMFITQSTVSLTSPSFSGGCKFTGSTEVVAQNNGDQYNVSSGRTFNVSGFSSVTGTNSEGFSGGTSKIVKVVSQQDIDNAKQKITDSGDTVREELKSKLETDKFYALTDTFETKTETIEPSPALDQEAAEVTVTVSRTYAMAGVRRDDLSELVKDSVKNDIEERKQQMQNDGLDTAVFRLGDKQSEDSLEINVQTTVVLGPKIDEGQLKQDIAGKKRGDVENIVKRLNGVKDVEVTYSPFWVSITPKNTSKITVEYEEAVNQ